MLKMEINLFALIFVGILVGAGISYFIFLILRWRLKKTSMNKVKKQSEVLNKGFDLDNSQKTKPFKKINQTDPIRMNKPDGEVRLSKDKTTDTSQEEDLEVPKTSKDNIEIKQEVKEALERGDNKEQLIKHLKDNNYERKDRKEILEEFNTLKSEEVDRSKSREEIL